MANFWNEWTLTYCDSVQVDNKQGEYYYDEKKMLNNQTNSNVIGLRYVVLPLYDFSSF